MEKKTLRHCQRVLLSLRAQYPVDEFSKKPAHAKVVKAKVIEDLLALDQALQVLNPFLKQALTKYLALRKNPKA